MLNISSKENHIADFESRRLEPETEYELSNDASQQICEKFGIPEIDLFASRNNTKRHKYISWKKDPGSIAIDAFIINWHSAYFYAFPPSAFILSLKKNKTRKF